MYRLPQTQSMKVLQMWFIQVQAQQLRIQWLPGFIQQHDDVGTHLGAETLRILN